MSVLWEDVKIESFTVGSVVDPDPELFPGSGSGIICSSLQVRTGIQQK